MLIASSVPLYEIIAQATRSRAATTVFMVLMTSVAFLTLIGSVLAASRITWSFARDEALVFSGFVKKINHKQDVPIFALCFNAFWISAIGCIYLGSTTGNSIVSHRIHVKTKLKHGRLQLSTPLPASVCWSSRFHLPFQLLSSCGSVEALVSYHKRVATIWDPQAG